MLQYSTVLGPSCTSTIISTAAGSSMILSQNSQLATRAAAARGTTCVIGNKFYYLYRFLALEELHQQWYDIFQIKRNENTIHFVLSHSPYSTSNRLFPLRFHFCAIADQHFRESQPRVWDANATYDQILITLDILPKSVLQRSPWWIK